MKGGIIFCIILSGFGVSAGNCGATVTYEKSKIRSSREKDNPLLESSFLGVLGVYKFSFGIRFQRREEAFKVGKHCLSFSRFISFYFILFYFRAKMSRTITPDSVIVGAKFYK